MACLMKYIKLPVGSSKDQIFHHCPDNPSGPPNKGMTGGLNVPRLPQFPDNTGNNLAQDDDCDKQKEDGNCDNQKEDVNKGSKQMARQKKTKTKKRGLSSLRLQLIQISLMVFPGSTNPNTIVMTAYTTTFSKSIVMRQDV